MLSKEEIEKDIKKLRNISEYFTYFMWSEDTEALRRILNYIDQLESDKQKLIEKLELEIEADEEDLKYNNLSDYGRGCLDEAKEILEIVKGENHE